MSVLQFAASTLPWFKQQKGSLLVKVFTERGDKRKKPHFELEKSVFGIVKKPVAYLMGGFGAA